MSYRRVIPRDLFNEANLLKCYGRISILADFYQPGEIELRQTHDGHFDVRQNSSSGGLEIFNVRLYINGVWHWLERPLNSRKAWPLYVTGTPDDPDFDAIEVFDKDGQFSEEMQALIHRKS